MVVGAASEMEKARWKLRLTVGASDPPGGEQSHGETPATVAAATGAVYRCKEAKVLPGGSRSAQEPASIQPGRSADKDTHARTHTRVHTNRQTPFPY